MDSSIDPLDYEPFANLLARSYLVLLIQVEFKKRRHLAKNRYWYYVIILVKCSFNLEAFVTVKLIGTDKQIVYEAQKKLLLTDAGEYQKMANACNPYGDGGNFRTYCKDNFTHINTFIKRITNSFLRLA